MFFHPILSFLVLPGSERKRQLWSLLGTGIPVISHGGGKSRQLRSTPPELGQSLSGQRCLRESTQLRGWGRGRNPWRFSRGRNVCCKLDIYTSHFVYRKYFPLELEFRIPLYHYRYQRHYTTLFECEMTKKTFKATSVGWARLVGYVALPFRSPHYSWMMGCWPCPTANTPKRGGTRAFSSR